MRLLEREFAAVADTLSLESQSFLGNVTCGFLDSQIEQGWNLSVKRHFGRAVQ